MSDFISKTSRGPAREELDSRTLHSTSKACAHLQVTAGGRAPTRERRGPAVPPTGFPASSQVPRQSSVPARHVFQPPTACTAPRWAVRVAAWCRARRGRWWGCHWPCSCRWNQGTWQEQQLGTCGQETWEGSTQTAPPSSPWGWRSEPRLHVLPSVFEAG